MGSRTPSYRLHKPSGLAVVTIDGKDIYLGRWNTPESRAEYDRLIAGWLAGGRRRSGSHTDPGLSVNEVILTYWPHVEAYYRHPGGTPTKEVKNIKLALRPLRELYGHSAAAAFDSLALEAIRTRMIEKGLCRNRINKDVARIKRLFRWAASKKMVPLAVFQSLQTVEGLRAGRSAARETEPVKPVPEAVVSATSAHLRPQVAAMARLQLLTGMRPGEVAIMRGIDLDMTGRIWLYRPGSDQGPYGKHKTAHRGQQRIIPIGPRGQEVLRPWLRLNVTEYLFQPREAEAARDAERRQKRKVPMRPSDLRRPRKRHPKRAPGQRYTVESYAHAIKAACERAFPLPGELARRKKETVKVWMRRLTPEQKEELNAWRRRHHWHPNQLRHTKATEIRREAGLDAARAVLGHRSPQVTEIYAEIDLGRATEVMERLG